MPRNYHIAKQDILDSMPGTVSEIIKKSGYERCTVERWMRRMKHDDPAQRECHIIDWRRPEVSGQFVAVYAAGPGKNAPCKLVAQSDAEKWQRAIQLHGMDKLRAKERARAWALKARRGQVNDPLMQALFKRTTKGNHENNV